MQMVKVKNKKKFNTVDILIIAFFAIVAFIMIVPLWSVITISFSSAETFTSGGITLIPKEIVFDAYKYIFITPSILDAFFVSVRVTLIGTTINMICTFTYAYSISLTGLPGRKFFITLAVIPMFFNAGLIPLYITMSNYNLVDTIWSMILPTAINIWYLMIIKNHFIEMPVSIREAALIDGANEIVIFLKIMLPLSKPIIATFLLFYAVERWNEWFYSSIFISTSGLYTLQKVLRDILVNATAANSLTASLQAASGGYVASQAIKMATTVVAVVPIACIYPFLQKYIVSGITAGAVKG